jgi:hypothetical protein
MDHGAAAPDDLPAPPAAVIALLGLPASGKSTIAAVLAASQPGHGAQQRLRVHVASLDQHLARLSAAGGPCSPGGGGPELPGPGAVAEQAGRQHFDPALWKVGRA